MAESLLYLDRDSTLDLQAQIRQKLVEAIDLEVLKPGSRLPSSRKLAQQLGVARNTVVIACQQLVAEGLLTGKARSGLYVAQRVARPLGVCRAARRARRPSPDAGSNGSRRGRTRIRHALAPADARDYPYLFPRRPVRYVTVSGARMARGLPLCARRRRHRGLVGRDRRARRSDADRGTAHQDPAAPGHQCARRRNPDHGRCAAGAVPARGTAGRLERLGRHRRARAIRRCGT